MGSVIVREGACCKAHAALSDAVTDSGRFSDNKSRQGRTIVDGRALTHNKLYEMINLFSKFKKITKEQAKREITIILKSGKKISAIAVDSIISVEKLASVSIEPMPVLGNEIDNNLFSALAKRSKDNSLILLMDVESIIQETNSTAIS